MTFAAALPAALAAFLASLVEVVEAFTIVLAVSAARGPRPALLGAGAGLAALLALALVFGPALSAIPLWLLQLVIGVLLLLFGLRWLRKAILRSAGIIPMHDEDAVYAETSAELAGQKRAHAPHLDWLAGMTAFKAVMLEGLEVIFIVIALGASGRVMLYGAGLGALAAFVLVLAVGMALHKPLSRVPENALKFGVGVMLSAFGVFWTGEGLGVEWPGRDFAILVFAAMFLGIGLLLANYLRGQRQAVTP
jgi:Ca2+/H+ antiporter, TMEM165/GDT1 family